MDKTELLMGFVKWFAEFNGSNEHTEGYVDSVLAAAVKLVDENPEYYAEMGFKALLLAAENY